MLTVGFIVGMYIMYVNVQYCDDYTLFGRLVFVYLVGLLIGIML
jgi:hypothetical protein